MSDKSIPEVPTPEQGTAESLDTAAPGADQPGAATATDAPEVGDLAGTPVTDDGSKRSAGSSASISATADSAGVARDPQVVDSTGSGTQSTAVLTRTPAVGDHPDTTPNPDGSVPFGALLAASRERGTVQPGTTGEQATAWASASAAGSAPSAHSPSLLTMPPPLPPVPPRWQRVARPPGVLPAASLAGVVGATVIPLDRPGIGWLITGAAVTAALCVVDYRARSRATSADPSPDSRPAATAPIPAATPPTPAATPPTPAATPPTPAATPPTPAATPPTPAPTPPTPATTPMPTAADNADHAAKPPTPAATLPTPAATPPTPATTPPTAAATPVPTAADNAATLPTPAATLPTPAATPPTPATTPPTPATTPVPTAADNAAKSVRSAAKSSDSVAVDSGAVAATAPAVADAADSSHTAGALTDAAATGHPIRTSDSTAPKKTPPGAGTGPAAATREASPKAAASQTVSLTDRIWWAAAALLLLGVGAVRAAEWLFVLCVLAACVAGSLAVMGRRSVRGIAHDMFAVPLASFGAVPWAFSGLRESRSVGTSSVRRYGVSVAATAALLVVFVPLLGGADATFAKLLNGLVPTVDGPATWQWIFLFAVVTTGVLGSLYLLAGPPPRASDSARPRRLWSRSEWMLPVGALTVLFAVFVGAQFVALFGGDDYVQRTAGLTYAEYARSGFWQLSAVSVLTLAVILSVLRWSVQDTAADRRSLRVLLSAVSVLALVIVCSALGRMWTYQQAYGFTVLRLLVTTCELWVGLVYVLVLVAIARLRWGWVSRAAIGTALGTLIALALLNPEHLVAERNIDRWQTSGRLDADYLSGLSPDILTALDPLPAHLRAPIEMSIRYDLEDDHWWSWNFSRSSAR
ncbi:DUF4153 domain-containing protein [Nocardia fluminea]|uniref:Uncharacterized protein DUF4173 n=1 Tax=Nocardia fluminea TaxID=134984 RepID=A0A2N3VIX9_9NOCA|nr:DUF4173 domain-containing protein [Nocardia fluminea]PKV81545.1 uncharacterized protein DUF4173 [Nocardia fluminea]